MKFSKAIIATAVVVVLITTFLIYSVNLFSPAWEEDTPKENIAPATNEMQIVYLEDPENPENPDPQPPTDAFDGICWCYHNAYDCEDLLTQADAQECFEYCGGIDNDIHWLDDDKDGIACEWLD